MKKAKSVDFSKAKQGAVIKTSGKKGIYIRLDEDLLHWFKDQVRESGGGNYQTNINQALRDHMAGNSSSDESVSATEKNIRRVILEIVKPSAIVRTPNVSQRRAHNSAPIRSRSKVRKAK